MIIILLSWLNAYLSIGLLTFSVARCNISCDWDFIATVENTWKIVFFWPFLCILALISLFDIFT